MLREKLLRMQNYIISTEHLSTHIIVFHAALSKLERYLQDSCEETKKDFDEKAVAEEFAALLARLKDVPISELRSKELNWHKSDLSVHEAKSLSELATIFSDLPAPAAFHLPLI